MRIASRMYEAACIEGFALPESTLEVSWTAVTQSASERWVERACLSLTGAAWERAAQGNILQDSRKPFIALITVSCVHQGTTNRRCIIHNRILDPDRRPASSDLSQKCGHVVPLMSHVPQCSTGGNNKALVNGVQGQYTESPLYFRPGTLGRMSLSFILYRSFTSATGATASASAAGRCDPVKDAALLPRTVTEPEEAGMPAPTATAEDEAALPPPTLPVGGRSGLPVAALPPPMSAEEAAGDKTGRKQREGGARDRVCLAAAIHSSSTAKASSSPSPADSASSVDWVLLLSPDDAALSVPCTGPRFHDDETCTKPVNGPEG